VRCPDCNKFTGLENADPQVDEQTADFRDGLLSLQYSVTMSRECAECSQEMKSYSGDAEQDIEVDAIPGYGDLPKEVQEGLIDGSIDVDVSVNESSEVEESGGGRYAKNIITTTVTCDYTLTFSHSGKEYKLEGQEKLECSASAGDFEEQV
jgi:hypothetical protein